ncbi:MAG: SRPBCC family protein [Gemmatimonadales bacterium]
MPVKAQETHDRPSTDRIEKRVVLRASRSRVWRAITTAEEFGTWFRMKLEGEFAEGGAVRGRITHPGYEHVTLEILVERIEPERYFSYRWHPYAIDPTVDYSAEPTTLVEFILEDAEGGTALTIVESGFDRIPLARRAEAFRMNDQGWAGQIKSLERYVS